MNVYWQKIVLVERFQLETEDFDEHTSPASLRGADLRACCAGAPSLSHGHKPHDTGFCPFSLLLLPKGSTSAGWRRFRDPCHHLSKISWVYEHGKQKTRLSGHPQNWASFTVFSGEEFSFPEELMSIAETLTHFPSHWMVPLFWEDVCQ